MTEQPVAYTATITNLTPNYDGFAVVPEDGSTIYIPPGVSKAAKLVPGENRSIRVVPNFQDKAEATKWLGVYVSPPEQEQPDQHKGSEDGGLEQELYEWLLESPEAYMTTAELATLANVDVAAAAQELNALWTAERVAKAVVYGGPHRTAFAELWAIRVEDFCA